MAAPATAGAADFALIFECPSPYMRGAPVQFFLAVRAGQAGHLILATDGHSSDVLWLHVLCCINRSITQLELNGHVEDAMGQHGVLPYDGAGEHSLPPGLLNTPVVIGQAVREGPG